MTELIVPLCLYRNKNTSMIGLPTKVRENDKNVFICEGREDTDLIGTFYVINPDLRPIPPGMSLICVTNGAGSETIDVEQMYDPFNIDKKCLQFIAFLQATPFTIPLYIYQYGSKLYMSFSRDPPSENFKEVFISPIYVLDPVKNPNFLFSGHQSRCVPDPKGQDIGKCLVNTVENIHNQEYASWQPTLLKYLEQQYGETKGGILRHVPPLVSVVATFALILIILFVVINGTKSYNKSDR